MKVPIAQVVEGERFRKDYLDLDGLVVSIGKYGLLQPIVLDRENRLLAGGRRLRACQKLGWLEIPATYIDEVDELRHREIELEENIQREQFHFAEEARLVEEIHRIKQQLYGESVQGKEQGWTQNDTATALDASQGYIAKQLALAKALSLLPEIATAANKTVAIKMAKRRLQELERELAVRRARSSESNIWCGDAVELLKSVETGTVDCIIMDPPYGVSLQDSVQHANTYFDDSPKEALYFLSELLPELSRVAKTNAHWYIFFSVALLPELFTLLARFKIEFDDVPLIWSKNTMGVTEWDQRYGPTYEPVIFVYGDRSRLLAKRMGNVFSWPTVPTQERHSGVEKPVAASVEFIRQSTQPGELVLDPCCGAGFVPVGAKVLGRRYIGIDKDETAVKTTILRIAEAEGELAALRIEQEEENEDEDV